MKKSTLLKLFTAVVLVGVIIKLAMAATISAKPQEEQKQVRYNESVRQWKDKVPQLFSEVGSTSILASAPITAKNATPKAELIGTVTNPFGIRDDILDFIIKTIPNDNPTMLLATIKMAQYDQKMIGVTDDKLANHYANQMSAAMYCMNLPLLLSNKFIHKFVALLRNTPQRLSEQERLDYLLNGHVISDDFGIDTYDKKLQCKHLLESTN